MKKLVLILILMFFLPFPVFAEETAENNNYQMIDEYTQIYGDSLNRGTEELQDTDVDELIPGFDAAEMMRDVAKGENTFSVSGILDKGLSLLAGEIKTTLKILVFIPVVAVLSTYLTNIQSSFSNHGTANTAFYVCYLIIAGILAALFLQIVDCGKALVGNISVFMRVMVPVLLAAMMSSGAITTATTFEVILLGIIEIAQWLVENFFIPLVMMTAALNMVNNLSESMNAQKLVQFMNKTVKWGIGIVMTLFVGVMGLQGVASGSADVLAVRLTKFATSNLVPMVGGALAETVETVMNCSTVIKNSLGVTGIVIIVLIAAVPVIKVAACLILFRLCAALIQPISDNRIVKCMSELADTVSCVFGLMMAVTVMFIIVLTIVINVGSHGAL